MLTFSLLSPGGVGLLLLAFCGAMATVDAQCDEYVHVNSSLTDFGDCACQVTSSVSSSCGSSGVSSEEFQRMVEELDQQIAEVYVEINALHVTLQQQQEEITSMNEDMNNIHAIVQRIIDQEIVISRPEYDIIRQDLQDMEELITHLESQNADQAIIDGLRAEIFNISMNLDSLEENNDGDIESLLRDIAELEEKLADCEKSKEPGNDDDAFPYPWDEFELQDSCQALVSLSEPYTVRGNLNSKGVWLMDPVVDVDKPWYQAAVTYTATIYRYPSMEQFQNSGLTETYTPSQYMEGCSVVAYNGALFFNQYNTANLYRYDYQTQTITRQVALPYAGYKTTYPYLYGDYSSIDFAVDEQGLWVIYGTTSTGGLISISKLNDVTLQVERTFNTNLLKRNFAECFMVCGRLYCTNSFNSHNGLIAMMYDTATQETIPLDIPFDSKYLLTSALKYNPRDQRLYAYDGGHALAYELLFQSDES